MKELAGKVAVVTGGASGIGKGIAGALAGEGMQVVLADVEDGALEAAASELGAVGIRTDVSDATSVQALADAVVERFGAVHVVCNNAGVNAGGPVASLTRDDWEWILGVNLWGVIHGVTAFLPVLEGNRDGGHIVNTASIAGLDVVPRFVPYCVTKFGVIALSEGLAQELRLAGSKVGVTVLCPGAVRTNLSRSSRNRSGEPGTSGMQDVDLERDAAFEGARWLEPDQIGAVVVRAVKHRDLYALPHPELLVVVEERHARIVQAFEGAA